MTTKPNEAPPAAEMPLEELDPVAADAALSVLAELKKRDPEAFREQSRREAQGVPAKK